VGEWDPVSVGGRAFDVVDADRDLGDDAEPGRSSGGEHLLVDLVPESGDEGGDPRADLLQDERLRGRLDPVVDLHFPAPGTQAVEGLVPDVAGRVDPDRLGHGALPSPERARRITLPA
jgi:hypothetical protein